jgi:hypothetical protein
LFFSLKNPFRFPSLREGLGEGLRSLPFESVNPHPPPQGEGVQKRLPLRGREFKGAFSFGHGLDPGGGSG